MEGTLSAAHSSGDGPGLVDSLLKPLRGAGAPADESCVIGADPVLPTRLRIGEAAAAALAAVGVAVSDLHELRTGRRQRATIEVRAAAAALLSFVHLRGRGDAELVRNTPHTTAIYPARGGAFVHLHGGFPHLRDGLLALLGCDDTPESIAAAVASRDAGELEDEIAARRLCGARVRSAKEWAEHPQGAALAATPLVEIRRIGDAPSEPLPPGERPLSGTRVLDWTRVLAGPTCGRTLAEHGADVMRLHAGHLPTIHPFVVDTGHGKLQTTLDLRSESGSEAFRRLLRESDVLSRGYRADALSRLGFDDERLLRERPGLIIVSINCYGHEGPWSERAGWEQLAQTVSGMALEQGGDGPPCLVPAAATDYTTGYLAALGALTALHRRATEGGSYEVRVSLARTAAWLLDLPRIDGAPTGFDAGYLAPYMQETATANGSIGHLGPVLRMSETPTRWARPTAPLGAHPPEWPARSPARKDAP